MYSRTHNAEGSSNTRCLYCFLTVASDVPTQIELDRIEATHICPEKALAQLLLRGHSFEMQIQTK
jgi:hypothetical protein